MDPMALRALTLYLSDSEGSPGAFLEPGTVANLLPSSSTTAWLVVASLAALSALLWVLFRRASTRADDASLRATVTQASLDEAVGKVFHFSDSQARFVGNLAMEIESPLATASLHADLLLSSSNEPATVQRYARGIAEDMRHLSDLVSSFLRLARPFGQEDISRHVPVPFYDVTLEAVRRRQTLAASRDVSVVPLLADSDADAMVEVMGDAVLLEAMIENLLRNAVLAAPRGSSVDLKVTLHGDDVALSVRDHGSKIDEAAIASVFEGFFQVPAPPRPVAGSGLSLAIARRVAEHHRGTISLRNVADGGCEFEVQLRRWRSDRTAPARPMVFRSVAKS